MLTIIVFVGHVFLFQHLNSSLAGLSSAHTHHQYNIFHFLVYPTSYKKAIGNCFIYMFIYMYMVLIVLAHLFYVVNYHHHGFIVILLYYFINKFIMCCSVLFCFLLFFFGFASINHSENENSPLNN
jgi:hypothetical protein